MTVHYDNFLAKIALGNANPDENVTNVKMTKLDSVCIILLSWHHLEGSYGNLRIMEIVFSLPAYSMETLQSMSHFLAVKTHKSSTYGEK